MHGVPNEVCRGKERARATGEEREHEREGEYERRTGGERRQCAQVRKRRAGRRSTLPCHYHLTPVASR